MGRYAYRLTTVASLTSIIPESACLPCEWRTPRVYLRRSMLPGTAISGKCLQRTVYWRILWGSLNQRYVEILAVQDFENSTCSCNVVRIGEQLDRPAGGEATISSTTVTKLQFIFCNVATVLYFISWSENDSCSISHFMHKSPCDFYLR
jgi:hypothetical protein